MQKQRSEVKPFTFSEISGDHVVTGSGFQSFTFKDLKGDSHTTQTASDAEIRSERSFAAKNDFKIDEMVKDYRGLSRQEQNDLEKKIQEEVNKRVEAAYQTAYAEGLAKGEDKGRSEALSKHTQDLDGSIEEFIGFISSVQSQTDQYLDTHKAEIHEFIKRFTKWIVMKEIDEKVYLEQLLEKLVLELNSRKNLIIKVGRAYYESMPDALKKVESRIGQLQNIRIEIVADIKHPGIILESENGLIDGSLEGVFGSIDRIFEQVLGNE